MRKPKWGRSGSNLLWVQDGVVVEETGGLYGGDDCIWQAPTRTFKSGSGYSVFGVWMVQGRAAGLGIREDSSRITGPGSRFIPHLLR